jgi:hypothetical protein
MRAIHTLVITIFCDDDTPDVLRGRVRHVADNSELTFTNVAELVNVLRWLLAQQTPNQSSDKNLLEEGES